MIPELGHYTLILAFTFAIALSIFPIAGYAFKKDACLQLARPLAYVQFLCVSFSYVVLTYAFLANDFSVLYVATNSNSQLPWYYRLCAVWGAHEGSLLLWVLLLSGWTAAVAKFSRHLPLETVSRVLSILGMISIGFLLFILLTSNPFSRLLPYFPIDGKDLNPLLQDPGLIIHPPMLYMGYVGFSVAFAFAISALITGRLDIVWAQWMKPWTLIAWCFLTSGIILGSWWAYRQLGWGGWWFWDPVENASFLPWLTGTALIHSLTATEKRDAFKAWTALLAIFTFSLSLIGTFLVRSGVLISVHAFAVDPSRGIFILCFLLLVIGISLFLYAWRANKITTQIYFNFYARESLLLLNNILLTGAMLVILLGTLYPLLMDTLGLDKISVGPPYFNLVFIPFMAGILFFMGIAPLSRWENTDMAKLVKNLMTSFVSAIILAFIVSWVMGRHFNVAVISGMFLAFWVILSTLRSLFKKTEKFFVFRKVSMREWGMIIAHIGVAVCVIGVVLVSHYDVQRELRLSPGETTRVAGYEFHFLGVRDLAGANYQGVEGGINVLHNGKQIGLLKPEQRFYTVQKTTLPKSDIAANVFRDIYVALGEPLENDAWSVRIYYKPFVRWIWIGGVLMIVGGICALLSRRRNNVYLLTI